MLLDGGERFADPGPELTGKLTQCIEDFFFFGDLHLLFHQDVSCTAVTGA